MSCHLWQVKRLNGKCLSEFSRIYATSSKNSRKKSKKTQATLQKFFVCHTDEFCYIDKVLVILSEAKYP